MPENPLELGVNAGASKLVGELDAIDRTVGRVAPLGRRLMTHREKLLSTLATPASQWTPEQAQWTLQQLLRQRKG